MRKIIYTKTDEAPALATHSFLPIVKAFASKANVEVDLQDISLAGRILAVFPDYLKEDQKVPDALTELGVLAKKPEANIIKLPNISASVPQLKAAIKELQDDGFAVPNYPEEPGTEEEKTIKQRYDKVKGSAVNPVLREGNSDRRAPKPVKAFAQNNPHSMGTWSADSKSHVSTMSKGDFRHNEKSQTIDKATTVKIQHTDSTGKINTLKENLALLEGEIIDTSLMSKKALLSFLETNIADSKAKGILFSLHMKATMMKVSDPIIFGHAVRCYFKKVFEQHQDILNEIGVDTNNGFGDLINKIDQLPADKKTEIEKAIQQAYEEGPDLAMVNSDPIYTYRAM